MSEQSGLAVKAIYFLWLQKNLDKYRFISEKAKELRTRISELSADTGSPGLMKEYYIQFCSLLAKNPYDVLLGLNSLASYDIVTYDPDFFPVQNQYGVYVPIRFLQENNLPVNYSFAKEKKQAEARLGEIRASHKNRLKSMEDKIGPVMKRHGAKSYKFILMLLLIPLCIYFFFTRSNAMAGFTWNNTIEFLALFLAVIAFIIFIRSAIEYRNSLRLKNARKQWNVCLSMNNYFESLPLKFEEFDRRLSKRIAETGDKIPETDIADIRPFTDDIEKVYNGLMEFADKPKLSRRRVGFLSVIFMLGICVFFYFLRYDEFVSRVNSLNSLFRNNEPATYATSSASSSASPEARVIRQVRIVAPEAEMLTDAGRGDAIATYKADDILAYNDDPGSMKVIDGLEWYKFTRPDGTAGWIVQTSIKFFNENEIEIKSVSASSTLTDTKGFEYKSEYVCDGYFATCWQEGGKGAGIGKYLEFEFKEESPVSRIIIINGNSKTEESYLKNNRLKKARLVFSDKSEMEINLEDNYSMTGQTINLPSTVKTKEVYLYIEEVYNGKTFNDTCISEIAFYR